MNKSVQVTEIIIISSHLHSFYHTSNILHCNDRGYIIEAHIDHFRNCLVSDLRNACMFHFLSPTWFGAVLMQSVEEVKFLCGFIIICLVVL